MKMILKAMDCMVIEFTICVVSIATFGLIAFCL